MPKIRWPSRSSSVCRTFGLPGVDQTLGEPLDDLVLPLRRLEQAGPAIGARLLLIERGDEGRVEQIREEDSLW